MSKIGFMWMSTFVLISLLQALVLYGEAVSRDLFPSVWQRSLYNEPGLHAMPWWDVGETGYQEDLTRIVNALENITRCVCVCVCLCECREVFYLCITLSFSPSLPLPSTAKPSLHLTMIDPSQDTHTTSIYSPMAKKMPLTAKKLP